MGTTIAQSHTAVPVSTDEVLKELQRTLNTINPNAVGDLVSRTWPPTSTAKGPT